MKKRIAAVALAVLAGTGMAASHQQTGPRMIGFFNGNFVQPGVGAKVCKMIQVPQAKLVAPKGTSQKLFYLTNFKGDVLGVADNSGRFYALVGKVEPHQVKVKKLMMQGPKGLRIDFMCYPKVK